MKPCTTLEGAIPSSSAANHLTGFPDWLATGFDSFFRASLEFQFLPQGNPVKIAYYGQASLTTKRIMTAYHCKQALGGGFGFSQAD